MSDLSAARLNMVESQIHTNDVTDLRILAAMKQIPREKFVPASLRSIAYMGDDIKLADEQGAQKARYLMAPPIFAKMIQFAEIEEKDLVLDVGCATGYSTAVLAQLADSVVGLEEDPKLADQATKTLTELEIDNAAVVTGDMAQGYEAEGPYDVILINGAISEVPEAILQQLREGGRLVALLSDHRFGCVYLYQAVKGQFYRRALFDAGVAPLPGFEAEQNFVF